MTAFKKIAVSFIAVISVLGLVFNAVAEYWEVAETFYRYADSHQYWGIHELKKKYSINTENRDGLTAWCIAKINKDTDAMRVLERAGADTHADCKETKVAPVVWWGVGAAAAGGALALALQDDENDPCRSVSCPVNGHCTNGACVCNEGFLRAKEGCYRPEDLCNGRGTWSEAEQRCVTCEGGFTTDSECGQCPSGLLNYHNVCTEAQGLCADRGAWSEEQQVCVYCNNGFTTESECERCPTGELNYKGLCTPESGLCSGRGTWSEEDQRCTSCQGGFTTDSECAECPSGQLNYKGTCLPAAELCAGRGTWNEEEQKCTSCNNGFTTESECESCPSSELNYHGTCTPESGLCNGRGTWSEDLQQCLNCTGGFTEASECADCPSGQLNYNGICQAASGLCNGHGTWNETRQECDCTGGFTTASECAECPSNEKVVGNQCMDTSNYCNDGYWDEDNQTCVCNNKEFDPANFCRKCLDTSKVVVGNSCEDPEGLCNGHGSWIESGQYCSCDGHWGGSDCNQCETGYTGANCDECASGYTLVDGQCVSISELCVHGTWQDGTCTCDDKWDGQTCNQCEDPYASESSGCTDCIYGYVMYDGECTSESSVCSGHGTWDEDKCTCEGHWTGDDCDECAEGYTGTYCNECTDSNADPDRGCKQCKYGYVHYQGNCVNPRTPCNNHGDWVEGYTQCMCDFGYNPTGACADCLTGYDSAHDCQSCAQGYVNPAGSSEDSSCSGCFLEANACSNHGSWSNSSCQCEQGFSGVCCQTGSAAAAASVSKVGLSVEDDVRLDEVEAYGEKVARMLALVRRMEPTINVVQEEEGDAYGVQAGGKVSAGEGKDLLINVENRSQTGDAYGIDAKSVDLTKGETDIGEIDVQGNAHVYGIKAKEDVSTNWNVNAETKGTGKAFGIYADASASPVKQNLHNAGTIQVVGENAETLTGIYAKNYNVDNSGKITVKGGDKTKAYGIYADNSNVVNSGEITVEGGEGSYGIYGQNHSSVLNTGKISLNGDICEGENCENGKQIGLDNTSVLKNSGQIQSTGALNFNKIGGRVLLGKGGSFEAESLSGKLGVASDVVSEGFKNEYVEENALKGENKDLEVESNSAMFRASSRAGAEEGASDVVMNRQAFNTISQSQSIADYLEANYQQEKNEELFQKLKAAETQSAYEKAEAELTGTELIPNFSQENMRVLRNLNATMTDDLLNTEGKDRKVVGYDYQYSERGDKGTLTGYENYANTMYFMYDKELENMLNAGLGMSITQFRSDYEDNSNRKEMMVQVLAPLGYNFKNGLKWQSIGRLGYSDGSYDRRTSNGTFEADLTSWIYGISNALRYSKDLGFATLEPEAQFNVLGYYQNRIREDTNKPLALRADAANNVSVESGFGLFIKRNMAINEYSKLKMKIGGMWYHEFANPYHSLTARHNGMVGKYRLRDRNGIYNRNRGVLRADVEYDWHSFTFYIVYRQYLEDEDPMAINAGVKYKF